MKDRPVLVAIVLLLLVLGAFATPAISAPIQEIGCKNKNYFAKDSVNEPGVERGHFKYDDDETILDYDLKILKDETFLDGLIHIRAQNNPPVLDLDYTQGWSTLTEDDLLPPYEGLTFHYLRLLMDYNMTYLNLTVETETGTKEVLAPIFNNGVCILSDSLIMGIVFYDDDGDGIFDAGEYGIEGIEVSVANGETDAKSTDGSGMFLFSVYPGQYTVSVDPDGYNNTTPTEVSVDVPIGSGAFVLFGLNGTPPTPQPAIDIEKNTNGEDADSAPGPSIPVGESVEWVYVVTNTGNVDLENINITDDQLGNICTISSLQPGESDSCTAYGTVEESGQYSNIGTATVEYDGTLYTDTDPSHYFGIETVDEPAIDIEKSTNGYDADDPPGPEIPVGTSVEWTYVVKNIGNKLLQNVTVTDDDPAVNADITCPESKSGKISLQPLESITCTATGIATEGQYANNATTSGKAGIIVVKDTDPSHYFGIAPDKAMIRGTAFVDENGNGQLDTGESGRLENIIITLNISGSLQTTSTDSGGNYFFANLATDVPFGINATLPAGYFRTTPGTVFNETSVLMQFINFGYAPDESPFGVVFGTVYEDANHNQAQDIGEGGLVDVSMQLDTNSGTVDSNTTKVHGQYTFRIDTDGTYYVIETDPPEYVSTTPNNVTVYLETGSSGPSPVDFGDFHGAMITGMVFNDTSVDGIKDSNEGGVAGATITAGADSFNTGSSGTYTLFVNATGDVFINETDPAGYVSTNAIPGAGADKVDANSLKIPDITWGNEYDGNDFGDVLASDVVTITGHVIDDTNANGALDAGEDGLAGAVVRVSSGLNQTTDSTGTFVLYAPANIFINVTETNPPGYISTNAIPGSYAEYLGPDNLRVNAPEGSVSDGNYFFDAAPIPAPLITGAVFDDANENGIFDQSESGIPDCNVTLEIEGILSPINTSTDSSGNYSFAVPPGINVTIRSEGPGGDFYPTIPEAQNLISPSAGVDSGNNFGYSNDTDVAVIYGIVFDDMDSDGEWELGELGLAGANITLNGTTSVITSINYLQGTFTFTVPGPVNDIVIHTVHEDNPPGYHSTTSDDLNVPVSLSKGNSYYVEFGDTNSTDTASIFGSVFDDCNGNKMYDQDELGIEGVAINLTDANGMEILNTSTDAFGRYTFGINDPGMYTVLEQDPAKEGYRSTTPDRVTVEVALGEGYQVDFGDTNCTGFSTIMGTVFDDLDGNGVQNGSEPGIPDVIIDLSDGSQTETDRYGSYQFRIDTPGWVNVTETDPYCYHSTTPNNVQVNVTPDKTDTVNFGDRSNLTPGVSFFGTVFDDRNVNTLRDATEPAIQGVTVTLEKLGETTTNTSITNDWGQFTFLIEETGEFNITEENPAGYVSTSAIPGHPAVTVVNNDRFTINITDLGGDSCNPEEPLDYGDNLFGDVLESSVVNITGYVVEDLDRDGNWSGTEPGLPGALVKLSSGMSQTTGADGYFELYASPDTPISVTETNPPNYISTNATAGDFATIIDFDTVTIDALPAGSNSKGTVFLDAAALIDINVTKAVSTDQINWTDDVTVLPGTTLYWRINISNEGDVPLTLYEGGTWDELCEFNIYPPNCDNLNLASCNFPSTFQPGDEKSCILETEAEKGSYRNLFQAYGYYGDDYDDNWDAAQADANYTSEAYADVIAEKWVSADNKQTWAKYVTVPTGTTIWWNITLNNTGNVPVTIDSTHEMCDIIDSNPENCVPSTACTIPTTLAKNHTYTCEFSETAKEGKYLNRIQGSWEYDDDIKGDFQKDAGYEGIIIAITLNKTTEWNGQRGDGLLIPVGETVTWNYTVKNTGDKNLNQINVTDNHTELILDCPSNVVLKPGESISCTATGTATFGPYTNIGNVTAHPAGNDPASRISAEDTSSYTGYYPSVYATVNGTVFDDTNANGAWDIGEIGLPGANVTIANATWSASMTTESDGNFTLTVPATGEYIITEINPAGYVSTNAIPGDNATKWDNDLINITISSQGYYDGNFFADYYGSQVNCLVFNDTNANGKVESPDWLLPGATITVTNKSDTPLLSKSSTSYTGVFTFYVPVGNYTITETNPDDYVSTNAIPGLGATKWDDDNLNITVSIPGVVYEYQTFLDFHGAKITGIVFNDTNRNGTRDGEETGLGGSVVTITNASDTPPWTYAYISTWTSNGSVLWSGKKDLTDRSAIFEAPGGGTLTFDTYYDIEEGWDFGFVQVSTDGGYTWTSLANAYTTDQHDPSAHPDIIANLPGLTGISGGWQTMSFDLSAYSGQDILIAFRYMTDWAALYEGWYIDNVYVNGTLISDGSSIEPFMTSCDPCDGLFTVYVPENGNYTITETNPPGYESTNATPGTGASWIDPDTLFIQIDTLGSTYPGHAFGDAIAEFKPYATITACKQNETESSLPRWRMILGDPSGKFVNGTTDLEGCTVFTVYESGNYTLSEDVKSGWVPVVPLNEPVFKIPVEVSYEGTEYPFTFTNRELPDDYATITACKHAFVEDQDPVPLTQWVITITNGTVTWSQATNDLTGCTVFSVNSTGIWTISETMKEGWYNISPTEREVNVTTLSMNGDYRPPLTPQAYYPKPFLNSEKPPEPATITACKKDDLGNNLSGWKMNIWREEDEYYRNGTTEEDGCTVFTVETGATYMLFESQKEGWRAIEPEDGTEEPIHYAHYEVNVIEPGDYRYTFVNEEIPEPNVFVYACKNNTADTPLIGWPMILTTDGGGSGLQDEYHQSGVTDDTGCTVFTLNYTETAINALLREDMKSGWVNVTDREYGFTITEPGTYRYTFVNHREGEEKSTIKAIAYRDNNRNGVQDKGESNLAGVTFTLRLDDDQIGQKTSDSSGTVSFTDLEADTYRLSAAPPSSRWYLTSGSSARDVTVGEDSTALETFGYRYRGGPGPGPTPTPKPPVIGAAPECDFYENGTLTINDEGLNLETITICALDGIGKLIVYEDVTALNPLGEPLEWATIVVIPGAPDAGERYTFMGTAYNCSPNKATFDSPITLLMEFGEYQWAELSGKNLVIMRWDAETGEWEKLPTTINEDEWTVFADVTELGIFALFVEGPPVVETPPEIPVTIIVFQYYWWILAVIMFGTVGFITLMAHRENEKAL